MADSTRRLTFEEVQARLLARCIPEPNSGCLLWEGSIVLREAGKRQLYGNIRLNGKMVKTHRVAYEAAYGPIPDGAHVLRRCDVGLCCNPAHLFLGDNEANIADKVAKDRAGKALSFAKAMEIHEMRAKGMNGNKIARLLGVNQSTLRSCPFCGSEAVFSHTYDQIPRKHFVSCVMPLCSVKPETMRCLDQIAAARAWNTRETQ